MINPGLKTEKTQKPLRLSPSSGEVVDDVWRVDPAVFDRFARENELPSQEEFKQLAAGEREAAFQKLASTLGNSAHRLVAREDMSSTSFSARHFLENRAVKPNLSANCFVYAEIAASFLQCAGVQDRDNRIIFDGSGASNFITLRHPEAEEVILGGAYLWLYEKKFSALAVNPAVNHETSGPLLSGKLFQAAIESSDSLWLQAYVSFGTRIPFSTRIDVKRSSLDVWTQKTEVSKIAPNWQDDSGLVLSNVHIPKLLVPHEDGIRMLHDIGRKKAELPHNELRIPTLLLK
jgi:hypothetical protein